jgi:hypothetical protein
MPTWASEAVLGMTDLTPSAPKSLDHGVAR